MEFFEVIEKRHSARSYKSAPVEQEKLDKILEAARLAPTACNRQAFKVIVIKTEGRREELKKIYNKEWFVDAPYILGICSLPEECWIRKDSKNYGEVDATIIMDHIILAATALGLGTCWIGAFDFTAAKEVLGLNDTLSPVAFTPVGYEKDVSFTKKRKPLEEIVLYK